MNPTAVDQILPHSYCCKTNIIPFILIDLCLICRMWFVSRPKSDCTVNFSDTPPCTKRTEIGLKLQCNYCLVNWIFLPTGNKCNKQWNSSISYDFKNHIFSLNWLDPFWLTPSDFQPTETEGCFLQGWEGDGKDNLYGSASIRKGLQMWKELLIIQNSPWCSD